MLKARKKHRIAEGKLLAVPDVKNRAACILVMQVPGSDVAVTAMNFSQKSVREEIELLAINGLEQEKITGQLLDIISDKRLGVLPDSGRLTIELPALTARTIVMEKLH
jgi:hypothetical protein